MSKFVEVCVCLIAFIFNDVYRCQGFYWINVIFFPCQRETILISAFADALLGIRELLTKFPAELKLHKNAVIEKLRERISDDDKVVRETLYQLFKSVILPGCKEVCFVFLLPKLNSRCLRVLTFVLTICSLLFDKGLMNFDKIF